MRQFISHFLLCSSHITSDDSPQNLVLSLVIYLHSRAFRQLDAFLSVTVTIEQVENAFGGFTYFLIDLLQYVRRCVLINVTSICIVAVA